MIHHELGYNTGMLLNLSSVRKLMQCQFIVGDQLLGTISDGSDTINVRYDLISGLVEMGWRYDDWHTNSTSDGFAIRRLPFGSSYYPRLLTYGFGDDGVEVDCSDGKIVLHPVWDFPPEEICRTIQALTDPTVKGDQVEKGLKALGLSVPFTLTNCYLGGWLVKWDEGHEGSVLSAVLGALLDRVSEPEVQGEDPSR